MSYRGYVITLVVVLCTAAGVYYYCKNTQAARTFTVAFLDVGQGDSTLIRFTNGEKMLIDCGPDQTVLSELGAQLPFYDRVIDYLLITHFDADHYAGCIDVLRRYQIKKIITNGTTKPDNGMWQVWYQAALGEHGEMSVASATAKLVVSGVEFRFLWPSSTYQFAKKDDTSNNHSLVFQLRADTTYLFTGDIEAGVERALLQQWCQPAPTSSTVCPTLQSDILKAAHHGSDTSSLRDFIKAVRPRTAIISVGSKNRFGHPSPRVLKRYQYEQIPVLRTDQLGAILNP